MKIRTDFVTNSSSSSFVVKLNVESTDGKAFGLETFVRNGDLEETGIYFHEMDKDGEIKCLGYAAVDEAEIAIASDYEVDARDFLHLGPGYPCLIDLKSIHESKNVEELIAAIKRPIMGESHLKNTTEFENARVQLCFEGTIAAFNKMMDASDAILAEHIKKNEDLQTISASYDFHARGECSERPEEMLEGLFGYEEGRKIYDVISNNDMETAIAILKEMSCLNRFDVETIENIIGFVDECNEDDVSFLEEYVVEHTLGKDGKEHIEPIKFNGV